MDFLVEKGKIQGKIWKEKQSIRRTKLIFLRKRRVLEMSAKSGGFPRGEVR